MQELGIIKASLHWDMFNNQKIHQNYDCNTHDNTRESPCMAEVGSNNIMVYFIFPNVNQNVKILCCYQFPVLIANEVICNQSDLYTQTSHLPWNPIVLYQVLQHGSNLNNPS